jgi:hypothetical protein
MRRYLLSGVATAALVFLSLPVSAQSLADIARQEAARRKAIKAPAKVITNADLSGTPGGDRITTATDATAPEPPVAPTPEPAAEEPQAASPSEVPAEEVRDENYWRRRLASARDALAESQVLQAALQSRLNALATDFVNRDDPAQRAVIASDRVKAQAEFDRVGKSIEAAQTEIRDTLEEARQAGVPQAWVR